MSNSDIIEMLERIEKQAKNIKDEIFRISWYMRGGVTSHDLFHVYSYEDRKIMNDLIAENIELTQKTRMALL